MAYTDTWNAAFEAVPADSTDRKDGADAIRDLKLAIRERMAKDHYFVIDGTDADHGEHVKVTLRAGSAPTHAANKVMVYAKTVSDITELFAKDSDGNEVQITGGGKIQGFPAGTKTLFYQDTAPTGWTIDNTLNDKLVFITKGSAAGGQTGGGAHTTGTWTQPSHYHDIAEHTHDVYVYTHAWGYSSGGATGYLTVGAADKATARTFTSDLTSGITTSAATAASWRPAAYCCIIATKD